MQILKIQVLRGPNIWSNYRKKLIQVRLDLEEMENYPTDKLPGFNDRIKSAFPTMIEHECSEGVRGGFFERLERGTWLGHVMEHVALEIQSLAGMEAGYGRTRGTNTKGIYNMVFSYEVEQAGLYAAEAAFRIVSALASNEKYDIEADLDELRKLKRYYGLGPSSKSIIAAAEEKNIPWTRLDSKSTIQLGYGSNQKIFQATITANTSSIAVSTACNKEATKNVLSRARIPIPAGDICSTEEELQLIIDKINFPIVIKPLDGNHGKGATINITDFEAAKLALTAAQDYCKYAIVEKYISGYDYRILVIDNKFVAASKRIPAHVIGDGHSTVSELLEAVNSDPKRGTGHEAVLTKITLDNDTFTLLQQNNYTVESIPEKGKTVFLKSTANLSTGGTAIDVTDEIHAENKFLAERVARIIGLDVCGIDVMAKSLSEPIRNNGGVVLEVNAAPGFRMHLEPSEGKPRQVGRAVVDMLYPANTPTSIPLLAVTGTNGKTTTTRLLAHIAKRAGYNPGYTTTDGIYIGDYKIEDGDTTGPVSAGIILGDPTVDFAVLETARGGILRSGLYFNECDLAIITNINEDHLGLNDIHTLQDLAKVKAVVARSVKKNGWAVLNADDQECVKIAESLDCNIAYFAMNRDNEVIKKHIAEGNPVAISENGQITIITANGSTPISHVSNIPLTMDGQCEFMIANTLAAVLAGYLSGFTVQQLEYAVQTFIPGTELTPGRLNLFEFDDFKVLVDYAHNPHGYAAIEQYLKNVNANRKIGIISGIGDRRKEDIVQCARIASRMFDHIIIRQEHDLRGANADGIIKLLIEGIKTENPGTTYEIVPDETESIRHALAIAAKGDFIIALSDLYKNVIDVINEYADNQKGIIKVNSDYNYINAS